MNKLTVEFHQFFLLVNFWKQVDDARRFQGGVVLLPSENHVAVMQINNGRPFVVSRQQVNLRAGGTVVWDQPGSPTPAERLVRVERVFGSKDQGVEKPRQMKLRNGLVNGKRVPSDLNARVVLSGGTFAEQEPATPNDITWVFERDGDDLETKLTDVLHFTYLSEPSVRLALLFTSDKGETESIDLPDGDNFVRLSNLDVDDLPVPSKAGPPFELEEYRDLHGMFQLNIGQNRHPRSKPEFMTTGEPICGGEQTDPDPPPDPPEIP